MHSSVLNEAITFFSVTNAPLECIYYSDFIQVRHSQMLLEQYPTLNLMVDTVPKYINTE